MSERVHLPVVTEGEPAPVVRRRHPEWIRAQMPTKPAYFELRAMVKELQLHTVCESASCPNIGECWTRKALTIMIIGDICTRSCRFCDVTTGRPLPLDPDEPRRVAEMLSRLGLEHTVITCVDRDDLADFGAAHRAETVTRVKQAWPGSAETCIARFQHRACGRYLSSMVLSHSHAPVPSHSQLSHVRNIEDADVVSHGLMFLDNACVLNRHSPPGERNHSRAEPNMFIVECRFLWGIFGHAPN